MGFTVEEANNTRKTLFDEAWGTSWTLMASFWRAEFHFISGQPFEETPWSRG